MLNESNDLLLRQPIDLDEPEDPVILALSDLPLAFLLPPLKVLLGLISARPYLLVLHLHVFDFSEYPADLLLDLGQLSQQIHRVALFVQKEGACHGLDLPLRLRPLSQLGKVGTQVLRHVPEFFREILCDLLELVQLCLPLVQLLL